MCMNIYIYKFVFCGVFPMTESGCPTQNLVLLVLVLYMAAGAGPKLGLSWMVIHGPCLLFTSLSPILLPPPEAERGGSFSFCQL